MHKYLKIKERQETHKDLPREAETNRKGEIKRCEDIEDKETQRHGERDRDRLMNERAAERG